MRTVLIAAAFVLGALSASAEDTNSFTAESDYKNTSDVVVFYDVEESTGGALPGWRFPPSQIEVGRVDFSDPENPIFKGDIERCRRMFYKSRTGFPFLIDRYFTETKGD